MVPKVHKLAWDFFALVFGTDQIYIGKIIRLQLQLYSWIHRRHIGIPIIWQWLSWCGVPFLNNWVNAVWDSSLTELMCSETPLQLSKCGMMDLCKSRCILCWISWQRVSFNVGSVCRRWTKLMQAYITMVTMVPLKGQNYYN